VVGLPSLGDALGQLPSFRLTVDVFEQPWMAGVRREVPDPMLMDHGSVSAPNR